MNCYSPDEIDLLMNFRKLDQTEQLIFVRGFEAMAADCITPEQMQTRVRAALTRYRAGARLTVAELIAIGTP